MVNYVKFMRCTQKKYNDLTTKDQDTLYFVYDPNSPDNGFLYLGNRLISASKEYDTGYISILDVTDIILKQNLCDGDILIYNEGLKKWENHALQDLLTYSSFVGATETMAGIAGLVPQPKAGDQLKFLMGDGTWQEIDTYDDELHAVVDTLVGFDPQMSVRDIAEDVTVDLRTKVGNLERALNGSGNNDDLGLRARVGQIELTIGDFQAIDTKYLDIGEAVTYLDNSIVQLNDRLRWHRLDEQL